MRMGKFKSPQAFGSGIAGKLMLSVAAVGTAAGVAGLGTFADFSDTETGTTAIDSGVVAMTIGASGAANRLSVAATDIVPGDTIQRAANLTVDSTTTSTLASITLTTTTTDAATVLTTDTVHGLKMEIHKCSSAWTEAGSSPAFTYTCGGGATQTEVLASRAIIGSNLALNNMSLTAGATNYLMVKVTLPTTADDTFQNKINTINYAFKANQRAGTDK